MQKISNCRIYSVMHYSVRMRFDSLREIIVLIHTEPQIIK